MRRLDELHLVRSNPFILISGDVISNYSLDHAILEHKLGKHLATAWPSMGPWILEVWTQCDPRLDKNYYIFKDPRRQRQQTCVVWHWELVCRHCTCMQNRVYIEPKRPSMPAPWRGTRFTKPCIKRCITNLLGNPVTCDFRPCAAARNESLRGATAPVLHTCLSLSENVVLVDS